MTTEWIYAIVSVIIVSLISFVGVFTLSLKANKLKTFLIYMVSFSAGALMGDAFIHLLPEVVQEVGFTFQVSLYILLGIVAAFITEGIIHWHHCHSSTHHHHEKKDVHRFAKMNLVGDGVHNFIDGLIIGASYLVSIPVGIATTLAVIFHEIPQEIGDFGVLLHGGYSKGRALFLNFVVGSIAVLGAIVALLLARSFDNVTTFLVPFAAGGFIYIAGSDLIPELHKDEPQFWKTTAKLLTFILGIAAMAVLLFLE